MTQSRFWLVPHAPVAGLPGIIHAADAPADVSHGAAIYGLSLCLPKRDPR